MIPSQSPPLPEMSIAEEELAYEKSSTPFGSFGSGESVKSLPDTCSSPRATSVTSPVTSEPESWILPVAQ